MAKQEYTHRLYINPYDYTFKVVLIGNSGVGKSSVLSRYTDDHFSDNYISTIGVDFKIKSLECNNKKINLQIWDTAGQERFRSIVNSYYKGAHGIILVYEVTSQSSFKSLEYWINEVKKYNTSDVPILLLGNKVDLEREVLKSDAESYASRNNFLYIETSAKKNTNIDNIFKIISLQILEKENQYMIKYGVKQQNPTEQEVIKKIAGNNEKIDINREKTRSCYCWE